MNSGITISSQSSQSETSSSDSPILTGFLNDPHVKNIIQMIKQDEESMNSNEMTVSDRRRDFIRDLAEYMEVKMIQNGSSIIISDISRLLTRAFERVGFEKFTYLILEVLPDKYKDKNKDSYKANQSRIIANRIKKLYSKIDMIDLSLLEKDDLYEIKNRSINKTEDIDKTILEKGHPLWNNQDLLNDGQHDPFDDLKQMEKNKFKPAKIGEPLATAQQLCEENTEYAKHYPELVKTFELLVNAAKKMQTWFTTEFPPLTIEDLKDLITAIKTLTEFLRPYYDKKYRRDHIQSMNISYSKVLHTSTKASHESQIACAHYIDKHGLPVMRGLTKEQIDSMYEWEINFIQMFINMIVQWPLILSRVNSKHGNRALEDRAMALSDTLSHHA
jgi:hypothetical protein